MRTLPLYYLVLALLIVFPALEPNTQQALWKYVLLIQNAFSPMPESNWFGTSWSLVIEEWSYILMPVLAISAFRSSRNAVLGSALCLCLAAFVFRLMAWAEPSDWDMTVRKLLLTRLDAIAYGVILAYFYHRNTASLVRYCFILSPLSVVLFLLNGWMLSALANLDNFYGRVLALPGFAIAVCLLMPIVLTIKRFPFFGVIITWIAMVSYAAYLVHWSVMFLAMSWPSNYQFIGYLTGTLLAAATLSYSVEQPIMRLRPKQHQSKTAKD